MTQAPRIPDHEPRDPHLLAALRHAPDHAVGPPPALSAQILAQARQAVQRAAPRSPAAGGRAGLARRRERDHWLTRPAMAGALATLVVATGVGVIWRSTAPQIEETVAADAAPALTLAVPPVARALPAESARRQAEVPDAPLMQPPTAEQPPARGADEAMQAAGHAPVPADPLAAVLSTGHQRPEAVQVVLPDGAESGGTAGPPAGRVTSVARPGPGAGLAWLQQLSQAARGRWRPAVPSPPQDALQATHCAVLLDGAPAGRLMLVGTSVWWWPQGGEGAWRADLDGAAARALRAGAPAGR